MNHTSGTHPDSNSSCSVNGTSGYTMGTIKVSNDYDEIYRKNDVVKCSNMWMVAPSYYGGDYIIGPGSNMTVTSHNSFGLRPIVCLNSAVRLEKTGDRIYALQ